MRTEGRDSYDIKKQEEVLQESYMMIPDSKSRLQAALEHLAAFLVWLLLEIHDQDRREEGWSPDL